jgi:hypothetical protein
MCHSSDSFWNEKGLKVSNYQPLIKIPINNRGYDFCSSDLICQNCLFIHTFSIFKNYGKLV